MRQFDVAANAGVHISDVIVADKVFDVVLLPYGFVCDVPVVNLEMRDSFGIAVGIAAGCLVVLSSEKELASGIGVNAGVKTGVFEPAYTELASGIGVSLDLDGLYNQISQAPSASGVGVGAEVVCTLSRVRMLSDGDSVMLSDVNDMTLKEFYLIEI